MRLKHEAETRKNYESTRKDRQTGIQMLT